MDQIIHVVRRRSQGRVTFGPAFTSRALLDAHYPNVDVQEIAVHGSGGINGLRKLYGHITPGERAQQLLGVFTSLETLRAHARNASDTADPSVVEIRLEG